MKSGYKQDRGQTHSPGQLEALLLPVPLVLLGPPAPSPQLFADWSVEQPFPNWVPQSTRHRLLLFFFF